MKRKAVAVWEGGLANGKGSLSTDSGVLTRTAYSFGTRFENGIGTNPEELIAAAHAGCFAMALSAELGKGNLTPQRLEATATVLLEKIKGDWTISAIHLELLAKVPGATQAAFDTATQQAKANCPVSRLLKATITLNAKLET